MPRTTKKPVLSKGGKRGSWDARNFIRGLDIHSKDVPAFNINGNA